MRTAFIGMVGLLGMMGCAPAPGTTYSVVIDPAFSAEDIALAQQATQAWVVATDGVLNMWNVSVGTCTAANGNRNVAETCIHRVSDMQALALGAEPGFVGFTIWSEDSADVYMPSMADAGLSPAQLEETLQHELGHSFHLLHEAEKTALMYPSMQPQIQTISCGDLAQFYAIRGIQWLGNAGCPGGGTYTIDSER